MTKVLFIQPNYDLTAVLKKKAGTACMPLALIELATYIREKGNHSVMILDRNLYPSDIKLINILKVFKPDIVGMTCYTSPVINDIMFVSKLIKQNSRATVIIGGVHATLEPKSLLDYEYIDYVVRGEGEEPLLEICNLIKSKKGNRKSILKLKNVNFNEMRPFINLNDLPAPDYDLIEIKKYPIAIFYTSRGCPGRCRFCYNRGRALRFYNTENIIKTMSYVIEKYGLKEFTIADDNFANLSVRTTKICRALSKYNTIFHIFLRVDQTDDKIMKELKEAGCWAIQFGFETGSQKMLDFIHKDVTVQQNINAVKQCKKYGIFVDGSFMIGLPAETVEDMNQTINFIKKYKPDAYDIKIFKPFPSTELYDYAIKKGAITPPKNLKEWIALCDLNEANINLSDIPTHLLLKTVSELNKPNYRTYLKKFILLIAKGHISYVMLKARLLFRYALIKAHLINNT